MLAALAVFSLFDISKGAATSVHPGTNSVLASSSYAASALNLVGLTLRRGQTTSGAILRERTGRYDTLGNLEELEAVIAPGRTATTTLEWYPNGNLQAVTSPPNARGQRYRLAYVYDTDTATWPTDVTDSFGYHSTSVFDVAFGVELSTTDLNNRVTSRTIDDFGRVTSLTGPREQGTGRTTVSITYQLGAPARAITENLLPTASGSTNRLTVTTFLDGLGRPWQTKTTARVAPFGVGMTVSGAQELDALGRVVAQGQPTFSTLPPTALVAVALVNPTRFDFDALGRPTQTVEANGATTTVEYTLATPPGGSALRQSMRTIDANRHERLTWRDAQARVTEVTEVIDGRTPTTRYGYLPTGELERVTDAAGNATVLGFDLLGRRLSLDNPDTGLHTTSYDAAGNVTTRQTPRLRGASEFIRYEYDFNRLTKVDYPFSEDVTYAYGDVNAPNGGVGRVTEVQDEAGVELREYGPLGEVTKQTRTVRPQRPGDAPRTYRLAFEWDSFGRLLGLTYPDGEVLAYQYDEGGLVTRAVGTRGSEDEVYLASVEYDEYGQRTRVEYGNGVVTRYTHDAATRRLETLTSVQSPGVGGGGRAFQALIYGYDAVGNVKSLTNALPAPLSTGFGGAVGFTYGYDSLNRLTSARGQAETRPGVSDVFTAGWEYSDIHNLTRAVLQREVVSQTGRERPPGETRDEGYVYDALHPHRARTIGSLTLEYDDDGNTVTECEGASCAPGRGKRFAWNEEGRLSEANAQGRLVRMRYDAEGQRVVKLGSRGPTVTVGQWWTASGNTHATKHIFAGATRVATRLIPAATVVGLPGGMVGSGWPNTNGCIPSGNQPQKCPVNGNGTVYFERGVVRPATYYYHPDALGSTQWLTDDEGKLRERVEYYPYGEAWRESRGQGPNKLRQAFLYTGKEYDEETQLTYFGARYYDSRRARWLSPDPALGASPDARVLSAYAYAFNSPLNYVDPDGQYPFLHQFLKDVQPSSTLGRVGIGAADAVAKRVDFLITANPVVLPFVLPSDVEAAVFAAQAPRPEPTSVDYAAAVAGPLTGLNLEQGVAAARSGDPRQVSEFVVGTGIDKAALALGAPPTAAWARHRGAGRGRRRAARVRPGGAVSGR
jgi:RHS repeat-associated protein